MPTITTIAEGYRAELIAMRRGTSSLHRHFDLGEGALRVDRSNWITLAYDTRNAVRSGGDYTAYRAITARGELLWFVVMRGKRHGFHAETDCPWLAIEMAKEARRRRREVRARWDDVRRLARAARAGRLGITVHLDDADASPLCAMGVRNFLHRVGLGRTARAPAVVVGWLMLIDEQVGFVLYEAARREGLLDCRTLDGLPFDARDDAVPSALLDAERADLPA